MRIIRNAIRILPFFIPSPHFIIVINTILFDYLKSNSGRPYGSMDGVWFCAVAAAAAAIVWSFYIHDTVAPPFLSYFV